MEKEKVNLARRFDKKEYSTGASIWRMALWYYISLMFFRSGVITSSTLLVWVLRLFGAKVGKQVRIKPHIHIKYPWKLVIGDNCWLADCYIDNIDMVIIGNHVCISQNAMLITGNHDFTSRNFDLKHAPISLKNGVWIGANGTVTAGVVAETHAVLCAGATLYTNMESYAVYKGNPAQRVGNRIIKD